MSQVSKRYSKALLQLAQENNTIDSTLQQIQNILNDFENSDIGKVINNPRVSKNEKINLIETLYKDEKEVLGFLILLINKNRQDDILDIFNEFIVNVKRIKGQIKAEVFSAIELTQPQQEQIKLKIATLFDKSEVELDIVIDQSLIGGLKIKAEGHLIDTTIKKQIYEIKKQLLA